MATFLLVALFAITMCIESIAYAFYEIKVNSLIEMYKWLLQTAGEIIILRIDKNRLSPLIHHRIYRGIKGHVRAEHPVPGKCTAPCARLPVELFPAELKGENWRHRHDTNDMK